MSDANIEQRIFDLIPDDGSTHIDGIRTALPMIRPESIGSAVKRLHNAGLIQRTARGHYRRTPGATRPADGRGKWPRA